MMELNPSNKLGKSNKPPLDRFGQGYNSDDDSSKWSDTSPALSRKLHLRSDVDTSPYSLHHTLGPGITQASPGNHTHDGVTSKKIGPLFLKDGGGTEPEWYLPSAYNLEDLARLISKFVEVEIPASSAIQRGTVNLTFASANNNSSPVVFDTPYSAGRVPTVFTNINNGAGTYAYWGSRAIGVTNIGFNMFVFKGGSNEAMAAWSSVAVQWLAIA